MRENKLGRKLTPKEQAFLSSIYEKSYYAAFNILKKEYGFSKEDLEDCISRACLTACNKIDKFMQSSNPTAWFITAVKNSAKDCLKEKIKTSKKVVQVDTTKLIDTYNNPENKYNYSSRVEMAESLFSQLSEKEKALLVMYYFNEMTASEIAEKLNTTASTVRSKLSKLREKSEKILHDYTAKK